MSTQYQPVNESTGNTNNPDPAYQWFLENRDEIMALSDEIDFLARLQQLESENNLASGTAERLKMLHDDASSVPEDEEERYAISWDAYQQALSEDVDLNTLARAYGERVHMPLFERITATGVIAF